MKSKLFFSFVLTSCVAITGTEYVPLRYFVIQNAATGASKTFFVQNGCTESVRNFDPNPKGLYPFRNITVSLDSSGERFSINRFAYFETIYKEIIYRNTESYTWSKDKDGKLPLKMDLELIIKAAQRISKEKADQQSSDPAKQDSAEKAPAGS
jgi:hypothetical protein